MKLKLFTLLPLFGCLFVARANDFKSHLFSPRSPNVGEETARKQNAEYEDIVKKAWMKKTKLEDESPSFYSPTFRSTITGKKMLTINNREIFAFQGFRYANGPRFQLPNPVDKFWDGANFNAIHIGFKCPQSPYIGHEPSGNEDCLYLNVYTPYNPSNITKPLTVMFFIHGGGFIGGDASTYLPTRLLDHDVILVTIHYRLGAFGFFTLNNEDAPGNIALYDMVAALNWVQTYIGDFGGDKELVTIFGESAGSVSVNYMMIAETVRDKGLYRAVIAESGSCFDHWGIDEDPSYAAHYIADFVGCDSDNDTELFECIVNVPFGELVEAESNLVLSDRHAGLLGFRGAAPTIQTFQYSDNSDFEFIITQHPKDYFAQNDFEKVPFMTGANKQEGSYVLGIMYKDYLVPNKLDNNVTYMREQMVQDILEGIGVSDDTHSLAVSLEKLYCPGVDMGNFSAAAPCLIDMTGALFLKAGSWEVANYHSYYSGKETYYYSFEFVSDDSLFHWLVGNPPFDGGITHSDEMLYIFDFPAVMYDYPGQMDTVNRMTKLWTNFAIYLNPTPENQTDTLAAMGIPTWTPFNFEDHHVLVIANNLTVEEEFSDRWTITMDELTAGETETQDECTGLCADYKDQRDAFEVTMIVFIVLTFIAIVAAVVYFIFKARS